MLEAGMTGASIDILPSEMLELIVGYLPHADVYACLTLGKRFYSVCEPALYASAHVEIAVRAQCSHIDGDGNDFDEAEYGGEPCTYTFRVLNNHEKLLDCINASKRIRTLAALIPSLAITCTGGTFLRDANCNSKQFKVSLAKVLELLKHLHPTKFLFIAAATYITLKKTIAKAVNVTRLTRLVLQGEEEYGNDFEHTFMLLQRAQSTLTSASVSATAFYHPLPESFAIPSLSHLRHLSFATRGSFNVAAVVAGIIKQAPKLEHLSFPRAIDTEDLPKVLEIVDGVTGELRSLSLFGVVAFRYHRFDRAQLRRDLTSLSTVGGFALHNVYPGDITSLFPAGLRQLYIGDVRSHVGAWSTTRASKDIIPVLQQFITLLETPLWQPNLEELSLVFLGAARRLEECAGMCKSIEELAASRGIKLLTKRRKELGQGTSLAEAGYRYENWVTRAKYQARARAAGSKEHISTSPEPIDLFSDFVADF